MTQLLWPPLMPLTWVRHHIVGAAVARSSRLQLAQAAFFHQKLTRHDLRWAVMVVARYGLVHLVKLHEGYLHSVDFYNMLC